MMNKIIVTATIAGLLGGYAAMLYAFVYSVVLIDRSYLLSLAMWRREPKLSPGSRVRRSQTFVHYEPRNLQPEPFRQFIEAHGEPLKALAFIIRLPIEGSAAQCGINPQCISLDSFRAL